MSLIFPGQRTIEQNNQIWGLVQRLSTYAHLDGEEVMRDLCLQVSGQPSSKALTVEQADKVIEELEARVKRSRQDALSKKEGEPPDPDAFHTQDQMDMMLCLFADLGWTSNAQQQGFYRRVLCHKRQGAAIFPHTRGEMRKVIEALKAIYVRKFSRQEMQEKVRTLLALVGADGRSPLTEWERETFLPNLQYKLISNLKLTPAIIKKLEEIWEKCKGGRPSALGKKE